MTKKDDNDNKIVLKIIVSGNPITLEVNVHQPLKSLMEKAFKEAEVIGGDENWYFSDEAGNELNSESKISELGLTNNQIILLNQRAGVAG